MFRAQRRDDAMVIATDGTYFTTLADVAWALRHTKSNGKMQGQVRANFQMDCATWTPQVVTVSGDDGSEPQAFTATRRAVIAAWP